MTSVKLCPMRVNQSGATMHRCEEGACAWYDRNDCAISYMPSLVEALYAINKTLFDTLGSAKTGDALDAIRHMAQMMEVDDD